jgi:hypothetical protein
MEAMAEDGSRGVSETIRWRSNRNKLTSFHLLPTMPVPFLLNFPEHRGLVLGLDANRHNLVYEPQ